MSPSDQENISWPLGANPMETMFVASIFSPCRCTARLQSRDDSLNPFGAFQRQGMAILAYLMKLVTKYSSAIVSPWPF